MKHLVAVDWGSSSLRGARLDADGAVLEERSCARGVLTVEAGGFGRIFDEQFADWMAGADTLALISGMAGSKQGWVETPYCPCPARFDDLRAQLAWVDGRSVAIVPGMTCKHAGIPDVMRGEETQVFGALQLLGRQDGLFVLPGTHSKWVLVRAGRIQSFSTVMTGEFYALLRQHSILARSMPAGEPEFDGPAFDQGVSVALSSRSLMQTAFSVRSLSLFDRVRAAALPSYLSGLVIGDELRSQMVHGLDGGGQVVVIGSDALAPRYERALSQQGVTVQQVGAQASWRGLWAIAQAIQGEVAV
jgi:2-dehydro-3-deoxygalactonokinase